MQPSSALVKQHRPRAGGLHVKTGCKTCKIRHVKCDEEKPSCLKCRSTGRVCDGYVASPKARTSLAEPQNNNQAPSNEVISLHPTPHVGIPGTDQERRSFEYFRWETQQDIGQALNLNLAHRLILQSGHSNAAVRSAVIALGSIVERLKFNSALTFENEQNDDRNDFAQVQYHQALKQLREDIANDPCHSENLAIMTCFLFTLFGFLQGNDASSMVHLRSGLNMLRQQNGPPDLLRQELLRIFSIMDLQATRWMGLKRSQSPMLNHVISEPLSGVTEPFSGIEDAAVSLTSLISRMYHFRRRVINEVGGRNSPSILAIKRDLGFQLEWWPLALERFLIDLGATISVELLHRILVMRMNHTITRIAFGACLHEEEERVFRAHLIDFRNIVSFAKTVIRPMDPLVKARVEHIVAANNASIHPIAVFSFYPGVIQPLYMTAIQCTDMKVCREAIKLLSTPHWREGAWDSVTMAKLAEGKVRQHEKRAIMAMAMI